MVFGLVYCLRLGCCFGAMLDYGLCVGLVVWFAGWFVCGC